MDETQLTVTDLARAMDLSKATLFEHLEKLIQIGLIKKIEDKRKWVYYKLTWKGKNILHPERTKIVIALTIFIISLIIISSLMVITGYDIFDSNPKTTDSIAPTIEFSEVEDINENSLSPTEINIEIEDNNEIDKSSLEIRYTIHDSYVHDINIFANWQELEGDIVQNKVVIQLPKINWSDRVGKYLYIQCLVTDKAGNSAQETYVDHIENIYPGSLDLSISISDIEFMKDLRSIAKEGYQLIPIKLKVHNTGAFDVNNVEISIFKNNPDTNSDGIVDSEAHLLNKQQIDEIKHGKVKMIKMDISLNMSYGLKFWVALDPENVHNETNEFNNIVMVDKIPFSSETVVPEFPEYIGFILVIIMLLISCLFRKQKSEPKP